MKICINCGSALNDDSRFCGSCGAPQPEITDNAAAENTTKATTPDAAPETTEATTSETTPEEAETAAEAAPEEPAVPAAAPKAKKPFPKKPVIIGAVCLVVIALAAVIVAVVLSNRKETVDCRDLVRVVYVGPEGHADAFVMLAGEDILSNAVNLGTPAEDTCAAPEDADWYDLWSAVSVITDADPDSYEGGVSDWIEKNTSGYLATDSKKARSKVYSVLTDSSDSKAAAKELLKLKISVDEDSLSDLSAGDKIHVTVKYDEDDLKEAKIKLTNTEFDITVNEDDLAKLVEIDPFKGFTVSCEGYEGNPSISWDYSSIDEEISQMFYYTYDSDSYYAAENNGDELTFTATPYAEVNDDYFSYDGIYYAVSDKNMTYTFKLSGLTELTELDVFAGLDVTVTGISPRLSVSVNTDECDELVQEYVNFSVEYPEDTYNGSLAIGDTIYITADTWYDSSLAEEGYKLSEESGTYEFTIPEDGTAYYANELSLYEVLNADEFYGISELQANSVGSYYVWNKVYSGGSVTDTTVTGQQSVLVTDSNGNNAFFTIYSIDYTYESYWDDEAQSASAAICYYTKGNYIDEEGSLVMGDYTYSAWNDTAELLVEEIRETYSEDNGYTVTEQ